MAKKILGIVGSYRKGGVTDTLVDEVLAAARETGAETEKIYLIDKHIEFCRNCRCCTQNPGTVRGDCVLDDDMAGILEQYGTSDGLVLAAPVNFFNVNAVTRRFMERLVCFSYWPWGGRALQYRIKFPYKKAVLITSTAMPGFLVGMMTGAIRALKVTAQVMGAKPVATITAGMVSQAQKPVLPKSTLKRASEAGRKLAE